MRLAKFLAHGGVASRRKAEEIIAKGVVTVGGEVVTDPARDVGEGDDRVDGAPVAAETREVWAVNKPAGVVSTAREPGARPAVVELVDTAARLYPVGRLDADSTGLLLLTNDGELANRLTHPRYEVPKTYRAALASRSLIATLSGCARASSSRTGRPARPRCVASARARSRSPSGKAATAKCGGCWKRWGMRWWGCVVSSSGRLCLTICNLDLRGGSRTARLPNCETPAR